MKISYSAHLIAYAIIYSVWLGGGSSSAQADSVKSVSPLAIEESVINYVIKDKEHLDVGACKELRIPLVVFNQKIKFLGRSTEGRFFATDLHPPRSQFWVTFHSLDLAKLRSRMTLGELVDLLARLDGPDPWLLIGGPLGKAGISGDTMATIQLVSEELGYLQFVRIRAAIHLEEDWKACRVVIQGIGVVRLNPLGFANPSPYGADF